MRAGVNTNSGYAATSFASTSASGAANSSVATASLASTNTATTRSTAPRPNPAASPGSPSHWAMRPSANHARVAGVSAARSTASTLNPAAAQPATNSARDVPNTTPAIRSSPIPPIGTGGAAFGASTSSSPYTAPVSWRSPARIGAHTDSTRAASAMHITWTDEIRSGDACASRAHVRTSIVWFGWCMRAAKQPSIPDARSPNSERTSSPPSATIRVSMSSRIRISACRTVRVRAELSRDASSRCRNTRPAGGPSAACAPASAIVASAGISAAIPARAAASCSDDSGTQLAGTSTVSPGTVTVRLVATGAGCDDGDGECSAAVGFEVQASTSPSAAIAERIDRDGTRDAAEDRANTAVDPPAPRVQRSAAMAAADPPEPPDVQSLLAENAALREQNDLLSAVIAHSPAVIFAKDLAGRFLLCNDSYRRAFPRVHEFIGKTDLDVIGGEAAEVVRDNDRKIREGGVAVEIEEVIPQDDGVHTYISIKFPLKTRDGQVTGIVGIATDISERKRGEEERARLQQRIIDVQRATLSELSTPIVPLADGVIAMPLVGAIDSDRATQIMQALLAGLTASRAHTAILDITGVRSVDTHVAGALLQSARAARLLGAQVLVTGIRPDVAHALVELGADWAGIETLATLQAGVARALTRR